MSSTIAPQRRSGAAQRWRRRVPGLIMATPAVAVFLAMFVIPMILAGVLSFTDWTGYSLNFDFVGWDNYARAFRNPRSISAAVFTGVIALVGTLFCNLVGLAIAALISGPGRSNTILRTIFFYPYVISSLIIGFIWSAMLAPTGAVNGMLASFGLPAMPFLTDPTFAKASVIFTIVWSHFGFNMILFLAGIKSVPAEYYEAATVDGASRWQQFRSITVPLIAPVFTVNIVLTLVGLLKAYDVVLSLTDGGPAGSTQTIVYQILKDSFANSALGFGAAQSIVLLIVTAVIGLGVTLVRRRAEQKAVD
ncbi:carbohydrate ABC transporter permease [Microbacterium esteraromaticum]|uniref:carbohydrate ABC transporter permease n=1 Tax=Microbacterium esteraromaticum TaxID=57043 RepID=UPI0019583C04|nr:sugar ABC transporter permease [Microbacterium esteraromaticum]MBM7465703.1 multiple sugar transport system permease protein/raffinose/stachyose/melibiose transport system permease protein [Microbacterium esteraromaticum]